MTRRMVDLALALISAHACNCLNPVIENIEMIDYGVFMVCFDCVGDQRACENLVWDLASFMERIRGVIAVVASRQGKRFCLRAVELR